jgi:hypothetical protein
MLYVHFAVLNKMHTALFITLLFRSQPRATHHLSQHTHTHTLSHYLRVLCCVEEIAVHKLMKYFNNSKDVWPDYIRAACLHAWLETFYIKPGAR